VWVFIADHNHRREAASHPAGTTVRVSHLFQSLPVRKQMNLKEAPKHLSRIKRLLRAYALVRPNVRMSLKVLRAKTEKGNFTYAPNPGMSNTAEDAMLKIFGKNIVSQCAWSVLAADGFELCAFLPRPDADPASISNGGWFISIDSRPMQATRGALKQIVALCKEALRKGRTKLESVKDPFLFLNFTCPTEAYDANVEPSKDDVLFGHEEKVINIVKRLLEAFYRQTDESTVECGLITANTNNDATIDTNEAFDIEREQAEIPQRQNNYDASVIEDDELASAERRPISQEWRGNMYGCDDEDMELLLEMDDRAPIEGQLEITKTTNDIQLSNPWIIAKMADGRNRSLNALTPTSAVALGFSTPAQQEDDRQDDGSVVSDIPDGPIISRSGFIQDHIERWEGSSAPSLSSPAHFATMTVLPTPPLSSSPVFGTPLDTIPQIRGRKKAPNRRNGEYINKPFVNPVTSQPRRDLNWFDFSQLESSQRFRKPRPPEEKQSRDIREFMAPKADLNVTPLIVQGEEQPSVTVPPSTIQLQPQQSVVQRPSQNTEPMSEPEISEQAVQERFAREAEQPALKERSERVHWRNGSVVPSSQKENATKDLQLTLQFSITDISQCMKRSTEPGSQPRWAALSESLDAPVSHLLETQELERLAHRLIECLQTSFVADDDFNAVYVQMREAFAQLASR